MLIVKVYLTVCVCVCVCTQLNTNAKILHVRMYICVGKGLFNEHLWPHFQYADLPVDKPIRYL